MPSGGAPPLSLRAALSAIARDRSWPLKALLYGALALSLIGLPLAVGFVLDSIDNSRKGYAYPLPPWTDWTIRGLSGILAMLIDFIFFVLPIIAGGMLMICTSVGMLVAGAGGPAATSQALALLATLCAAVLLGVFLCGAAPLGRLLFAEDGRIEDALSMRPLRLATSRGSGPIFLRARLLSLPAYLPAALIAACVYATSRVSFPGQAIALLCAAWLMCSALILAHLVVGQLYVAAERDLMRRA
ncbi:MAG: DUF4013 domain-containing protein [Chloroflexales bacterium]